MERIKEINIKDLSDETLMKLFKFNVYNCDKVIVKINSNITMKDIELRVLELNKIHYNLVNLLCSQDEFPMYSDIYNNIWTRVDIDTNGRIESVTHNSESISEIINMLMNSLINEDLFIAIEEYIERKLGDAYNYICKYSIFDHEDDFNYECEIEEQSY